MKVKKILRKSQPDFEHCVKKIETQAKKWFPRKKTCIVMGNISERTENPSLLEVGVRHENG